MQNPTLYARPLGPGPNFVGPFFAEGELNHDIPPPVREQLAALWRARRSEAGSDEEAWEGVYRDLGHPGKELGGYQVFTRLREAQLEIVGVTGGDPHHGWWWIEYGLTLPEDKPVDEPPWPALARLKRGLEKASTHYFRQHVAAYEGESGTYVRVLLDLGDRPLELLLYEDGYISMEVPLHRRLPPTLRARNYVLEDMAYRYNHFNLRVDGGSILVARLAGRIPVEAVGETLGPFIEDISEAAVELKEYLDRPATRQAPPRRTTGMSPLPQKTLCISVHTRRRGLIYTGPLIRANGVFNLNIPPPILELILATWDRYCFHYRGDKLAFALEYLADRLFKSPKLAHFGYAARFSWSEGECEEMARY